MIGTPTVLAGAYDTTDGTSYVTASAAVLPGRALVLWVDTSIAAGTTPGVTPATTILSSGCVWTAENDVAWPTDVRHGFLFSAPTGTQPTAGTLTLTMTDRGSGTTSTGTGWVLLQFPPGVNLTDLAVQAPTGSVNSTSLSITLGKPGGPSNRFAVFFSHRANEATTPRGAPWSELSDVNGASPSRGGEAQWLPNTLSGTTVGALETAASASWATSGQGGGLAVEMRAIPNRTRKRTRRR